jgi:outer membrane protein assembly factor BamB
MRLLVVWVLLCNSLAIAGDSWRQFRGPTGQGQVSEKTLPLKWSEDAGGCWKTPLPGRGWSSPVVANGRIWVTAAEERAADPAQLAELLKPVATVPVAEEMVAFASVGLSAIELDLATGKVLRTLPLFELKTPPPIHGLNTYASPTPVLADGRLFCHFGAFGTAGVDAESGEVLWRRELKIEHIVGPGSSPVVWGKVLIVTSDGGDRQFISGLDVETGETVWERDRPPIREPNPDQRKAFASPLVMEFGGRTQVVIPGAQWFVSYDPATGDELWRVDHGRGFSNVAAPVFDGRTLYLSTGYGKPKLWTVRPDGSGDVSQTHVGWQETQQVSVKSSPVLSDGRLYMISDGGIASCLDAATGETHWRERIPGQYSSSPIVGCGRVYFSNHDGRTTVVADSADFEVLARNDLDGMLMASPAAVGGKLLMRSDKAMYCIKGE